MDSDNERETLMQRLQDASKDTSQSWEDFWKMVDSWGFPANTETLFCSKAEDGTLLMAGTPLRDIFDFGAERPLTDEQWQRFLDEHGLDEMPPETDDE